MTEARPTAPLRIGTRASALALWQARHVADLLEARGHATTIVEITTQGDGSDVPFSKMLGKGFFTKEIEEALLAGTIDVAVHSMKDLMTVSPPGLTVAALIGEADARDVLIARPHAVDHARLLAGEPLPLVHGGHVGTSAARRRAILADVRRDLNIVELRGNVPTRLAKLRAGDRYDAIVLAKAGIDRLAVSLEGLWARPIEPRAFPPAAAQGVLGLQCRAGAPGSEDAAISLALAGLEDPDEMRPVRAERWLLTKLEGGCQLPFGCHVAQLPDGVAIDVFLASEDHRPPLRHHAEGDDAMALAEGAWEAIGAYRAGAPGRTHADAEEQP